MATVANTTQYDRAAIMRKAWKGYREMARKMRETTFNRQRFAFELRMAWVGARPRPVLTATIPRPVVLNPVDAARAAAIRAELRDMEYGDFIDWTRHSALGAELARLAA